MFRLGNSGFFIQKKTGVYSFGGGLLKEKGIQINKLKENDMQINKPKKNSKQIERLKQVIRRLEKKIRKLTT